MTVLEAIQARHSVRSYSDKAIPEEIIAQLQEEITACNEQGSLRIQLVTNEPKAFDSMMAHYGKFKGVRNYVALVGPKGAGLDEKLGYYGERVALKAQMLGLNTCWVAMSFSKGVAKKHLRIERNEKMVLVLALGYGAEPGVAHTSKALASLCRAESEMPDWFKAGMEAALLAPTAMNQQKFMFTLAGDSAKAEALGGFYTKVDLGIVKYHFEVASGRRVE